MENKLISHFTKVFLPELIENFTRIKRNPSIIPLLIENIQSFEEMVQGNLKMIFQKEKDVPEKNSQNPEMINEAIKVLEEENVKDNVI